jgi:hypothetical protein
MRGRREKKYTSSASEMRTRHESPIRLRICSRLEIIAVTRNQHGEDFGRLLQWHDCFVLPSRTIGQTANEQVILQSTYSAGHFSTKGTLEN